MAKISLQHLCNLFSKRQTNYLNLTIESGSKQRFSLLQEKSENFNSLRPIFFKLCKKKTTRGWVKLTPPHRRNRVKYDVYCLGFPFFSNHFWIRLFKLIKLLGNSVLNRIMSVLNILYLGNDRSSLAEKNCTLWGDFTSFKG